LHYWVLKFNFVYQKWNLKTKTALWEVSVFGEDFQIDGMLPLVDFVLVIEYF